MDAGARTRKFYSFHRKLMDTKACRPLWTDRPMATLQRMADRVWEAESSQRERPALVAARGWLLRVRDETWRTSFYDTKTRRIELARHQRNVGVVLHELAHALTKGGQDHGPAFTARCIYLYIAYGGLDPALAINLALEAKIL